MSSKDHQITNYNCLVIGGSITGLTVANTLQQKGLKVAVLEQNQNIGGCLATFIINKEENIEGIFDSGIQDFYVENPKVQALVNDWLNQGLVKKLTQDSGELDNKSHYCSSQGMNQIAQYWAKNLEVYANTGITEISYQKKWLIKTENQEQYQADMLMMAYSIPESLTLLDTCFVPLPLEVRFSLEQIEYDDCIRVLALLEKPTSVPEPGFINLGGSCLSRLIDNHQLGISPNGYAVTFEATPNFSSDYWDSDDAEIVYKLVTAAADYIDSSVIEYQVHRRSNSSPRTFYNEPCLALLELPLIMAGDAFVASSLEGAVMSGMAAGKLICQRFRV